MSEYAPCSKCGSSQFASDRMTDLEEENRLVSEQNKDLNDALIANEKELSERISGEELVKMQEEHYISWLSEKEARIHWAELWKKGCMALIGEQDKVKTQATRIASLEGWKEEAVGKLIEAGKAVGVLSERAEKAEASVVELREAFKEAFRTDNDGEYHFSELERHDIFEKALASSTDADDGSNKFPQWFKGRCGCESSSTCDCEPKPDAPSGADDGSQPSGNH